MTTKRLQPNQATHLIALPTNAKAALYIRRATAGESTIGRDLRELNTQLLMKFAHEHGYTDENIIVFNDTGIPATTPLEKREGMAALIAAIERREVKAVFFPTVYSLYRDASLSDIQCFIELCRRHDVTVGTPDTIFDFRNPAHVRLFTFALESEQFSIYARMHSPKRLRAMQKNHQKRSNKEREN
jgi:Resolvase, N terminal domain